MKPRLPTARVVSGLERVWLAAGRLTPPFAIHLRLSFDGPLDEDRWRSALAVAFQAHPTLRARLRGRLGGARWVIDPKAPPVGHARVTLDPVRGPCAAAAFIENAIEIEVLHAVTDGRGLWAFVEDAVRAYHGETPEGLPAGPTTDAGLAHALGVIAEPDPPADRPAPTGADTGETGYATARRRWPCPARDTLARVAASLVQAASAFVEPPLRLGVPVDLRRYAADAAVRSTLGDPGALEGAGALLAGGNLTGIAHIDLAHPDPAVFREALRDAVATRRPLGHARAAQAVRGVPLGLMASVGRKTAARHRATGLYPVSATLTWLGRHALRIDGAPLRVELTPPASPGMPLFLGLTAGPDGLEVVAVAPAGLASGGRLDRLLLGMQAALADPGSG